MNSADRDVCASIRAQLMAELDGERAGGDEVRAHLSTCTACAAYAEQLHSLHGQLDGLRYEPATVDVWPAVARAIEDTGASRQRTRARDAVTLAAMAAVVLAWRASQLLFDVPFPVLRELVMFAMIAAAFRVLATNPFAIDTSIRELHQLHQERA